MIRHVTFGYLIHDELLYSKRMISQISSVVYWCTNCFVWGPEALTVGVWSQNKGC